MWEEMDIIVNLFLKRNLFQFLRCIFYVPNSKESPRNVVKINNYIVSVDNLKLSKPGKRICEIIHRYLIYIWLIIRRVWIRIRNLSLKIDKDENIHEYKHFLKRQDVKVSWNACNCKSISVILIGIKTSRYSWGFAFSSKKIVID